MKILDFRALAAGLAMSVLVGCSGPSAKQESEPVPTEAATAQEDETTVLEDDFETGSAEEWAEKAPASDDSEADTEKE